MVNFDELLEILGVKRPNGEQLVLELEEHQARACLLPASIAGEYYAAALDLLSQAIGAGFVSVQIRQRKSSQTFLEIRAASVVGFMTSRSAAGVGIFVQVRPKISTWRLIELSVMAEMLPPWASDGTSVSTGLHDSLLEWTLRAFLEELRRLLSLGGLRQTHERVRANLVNSLKGRLLVAPWLRNASRGSPQIIPSEFPSLDLDNENNQILKWVLKVALVVARDILNIQVLVDDISKLERHFYGVSTRKFASAAACSKAIPPNMRHYEAALRAARFVLDSAKLGGKAGDIDSMSLLLDMNRVYEAAFFNGLRKVVPRAARQASWPMNFVVPNSYSSGIRHSVRMRPDIWIEPFGSELPIVIDTKWKRALYEGEAVSDLVGQGDTSIVNISSSDIYQAIAYGAEAIARRTRSGSIKDGCITALLYPALTDLPLMVHDIKMGDSRISLLLVAWNVSESPMVGIKGVWSMLSEFAGKHAEGVVDDSILA